MQGEIKIIRALWGVKNNPKRFYQRRTKIDQDIQLVIKNPYKHNFITYVFGKDNYNYIRSLGFEVILLNDEPIIYNMEKEQFKHKLDILHQATKDFKEIIFLDWDCIPIKQLNNNNLIKSGAHIQASLRQYFQRKATWREVDQRKIPCGSVIYIRGQGVTKDLLKIWETSENKWSEEVIMAKYTDQLSGGWKGIEYYKDNFEISSFELPHEGIFKDKLKKDLYFQHYNCHERNRYLRNNDV